ncbi:MAG: hypothetical protein ACOC1K_04750 [Nanoarchaeota archaeon]
MEKSEYERIYVIKYDFYPGFAGKYSDSPKCEKMSRYFGEFERDEFLKKYLSLKNSKFNGVNIDNIVCYTAILEKINDMDKIMRITNAPLLRLSYEESLKTPEILIDKLEEFIGRKLSPEKRKQAIKFIKPGYRKIK